MSWQTTSNSDCARAHTITCRCPTSVLARYCAVEELQVAKQQLIEVHEYMRSCQYLERFTISLTQTLQKC